MNDTPKKNIDSQMRRKAEEILLNQSGPLDKKQDSLEVLHELRVHQIELEMQNEQLRVTQQALEASRERYFNLFDMAPVGYCILNEAGEISETNFTSASLLGFERGRLLQQLLSNFVFKDDQDIYYLFRKKLLIGQKPLSVELRMIKQGGLQFWGRLEGVVNKGPDGQPFTRMVLSDVTRREEQLLNANKVLEDAHRELQSFNYSISHDLKSPLNTIISFCNIIIKDHQENLNSDAQQLFSRVINATKRMASVLDGLLEISRISRAELSIEEFDLSQLVQTLAAEFQVQDPNRKIKFIIPHGIKIIGDARLLTMVMSNLINNAFKFTANKAEAEIEFGMMDNNGTKTYFLRDNGAGFDMRHYGKLFTPFERLHSNNIFAGTGVGLASVQRVIQRHNGKVWAEGTIDIGATFFFSLK